MIPPQALVALNPLQWFATADGWLDWSLAPAWPELMRQVKESGFDAVHTRIPEGLSARQYGAIIHDAGLQPAPGTLAFTLPEDGMPLAGNLEAFRDASRGYAEIGLSHIFVIPEVNPRSPRVERPAQGMRADQSRLERIVEHLTEVSRVVTAEGVKPILHPHVGTWVETAEETRFILDRIDPSLMGFGPDVGHLSWAGADAVELISAYADRVHGVHVKDFRRPVLEESLAANRTYRETVGAGLWIEPGRGDFDYDRLWAALGDHFDGTIVVEVDKGDIQPPLESAKVCAGWVAEQKRALAPR